MAGSADVSKALTSLSFYSLDDHMKAEVLRHVQPSGFDPDKAWPVDGAALVSNRSDFQVSRDKVHEFVDDLEPVGFPYLDDEKAKVYEHELAFAYYIALADCELAILENTKSAAASLYGNIAKISEKEAYLKRIGGLIWKLRHRKDDDAHRTPLEALEQDTPRDSDSPTRYFGYLLISSYFTDIVKGLMLDDIKDVIQQPTAEINDGRLYLVWTAEMVLHICSALKKLMPYLSMAVAESILNGSSNVTGALGWILYFMRGGIEVILLIQNTVDMKGTCFEWIWPESLQISDEVRALNLTFNERWEGQWKERKFRILNDGVWGIINFICFFILTGGGALGYYGDVLNGVLFLFDFWLSYRCMAEAETEHEAQMKRYADAIAELELRIQESDDPSLIAESRFGLKHLKQAERQLSRDWAFQQKANLLDCIYSGTIVIAFAVLCALFVPGGLLMPLTTLAFALAGSAMCFTFGVIYEAVGTSFELEKIQATTEASYQDYCDYLELFKSVDSADDDKRRLLFLDMYKSLAKTEYQARLRHCQLFKMWTKILTDMLVPVLFIACFVFMPFTFGVTAFALGIALILLAKWQTKQLEPDEIDTLEDFPDEEYAAFCSAVDSHAEVAPQALLEFFKFDTDDKPDEDAKYLPVPVTS